MKVELSCLLPTSRGTLPGLVLALLPPLGAPGAFAAERFPDRPVRFIVPFPGGGTDAFARIVGGKLTEIWGQQIIVDNRSGAQGNVGTALGARASADGYTMLLAHQGAMTINPHIYSKPGFDTLRDFAAVARGVATANVLVVHPTVPVKSMKELASHARQNPGKLTFASTASGQQLLGELFKLVTATNMLHVPYKGAGPAITDLLGGNVVVMFSNPTSVVPHVKSGKLRGLAVLGKSRNEALPEVQSAVEAGYPELSEVLEWYGVVVPTGTPRARIAALNEGIVKAFASTDVQARFQALGQTPAPTDAAAFDALIRADFARWGKVVKAAGIRVD